MATHAAMQAAGMTVTAAAPMSGPYALAALADAIFEGEVNTSGPLNMDLVVTSYQHAYGNIYSAPTDVYEAAYAATADELLPSATAISAIYANGQLPQMQCSIAHHPLQRTTPTHPRRPPRIWLPFLRWDLAPTIW